MAEEEFVADIAQDQDFYMEANDFPVYAKGVYTTYWSGITKGKRTDFNDKKKETECFSFEFTALNPEGLDMAKESGQKILMYKGEDDEEEKPVKFYIRTGTGFGSERAGATKVLNAMCGKKLEPKLVKKLGLKAFQSAKPTKFMELMVTVEENDQMEKYNKVVSFERPAGLKPIDI